MRVKTDGAPASCLCSFSKRLLFFLLFFLIRGREGDELIDYDFTLTKPRRRSNSSSHPNRDFKTKFETVDQDPVFEEELHGPGEASSLDEAGAAEKESASSTSTSEGGSEEDDRQAKKA